MIHRLRNCDYFFHPVAVIDKGKLKKRVEE
jgi:hypothetical protein